MMIVLWKGLGWLAIVVPIAATFLFYLIPFVSSALVAVLGLIVSGPILWFVGRRVNAKVEYTEIDYETGRQWEVTEYNQHTLWFVPLQYWGIGLAVAGVFLFIYRAYVVV